LAITVTFHIRSKNPLITSHRTEHTPSDIRPEFDWITSTKCRISVPLSHVDRDPWGEIPIVEILATEGGLELPFDRSADSFTTTLSSPCEITFSFTIGGVTHRFSSRPPLLVSRIEQNSTGHPTFKLNLDPNCDADFTAQVQLAVGQQRIKTETFYNSIQSFEPIDYNDWCSIPWVSLVDSVDIELVFSKGIEIGSIYHKETFSIVPPQPTDYQPSLLSQSGIFRNGLQVMICKVDSLHPLLTSLDAVLKWADGTEDQIHIDNGDFEITVPFEKSNVHARLHLEEYNQAAHVDSYANVSSHVCSVEGHLESIICNSSERNTTFLEVTPCGDWRGQIFVEILSNGARILGETIDVEGQIQGISLTWLEQKINGFHMELRTRLYESSIEVIVSVKCEGEEDYQTSPSYSVSLRSEENTVQIENDLYFDEGAIDATLVRFNYDPMYYADGTEFTFSCAGQETVVISGSRRAGQKGILDFYFQHPDYKSLSAFRIGKDGDIGWKLMSNGRLIAEDVYYVHAVEFKNTNKSPAEILFDPQTATIVFPDLSVMESMLLPSNIKVQMNISLFGKKYELSFPYQRGEDKLQQFTLTMEHFFGSNGQERTNAWTTKLNAWMERPDWSNECIAEYSFELPSREINGQKMVSQVRGLRLRTDSNTAYYGAMKHLAGLIGQQEICDIREFIEKGGKFKTQISEILRIVLAETFYPNHQQTRRTQGIIRRISLVSLEFSDMMPFRNIMKLNGVFLADIFPDVIEYGLEFTTFMESVGRAGIINPLIPSRGLTYSQIVSLWGNVQ
jgi:hypothetical protein